MRKKKKRDDLQEEEDFSVLHLNSGLATLDGAYLLKRSRAGCDKNRETGVPDGTLTSF